MTAESTAKRLIRAANAAQPYENIGFSTYYNKNTDYPRGMKEWRDAAVDLLYYQYFLIIAQERSLSKAAEKLYVSQPYLSKILSRIEGEMGARLIDRSTLPIRLTPDGECFQHHARQIVDLDRRLRGELCRTKEKDRPTLILGTPPFLETHVMPEVLAALAQIYPHTRFQLASAPLVEMVEQMQAGAVHMVFALQHPVMSGALTVPVVQDRVVMALPVGHRFYRPGQAGRLCPPWFDLEQLSGDDFVLPPGGSISRQSYDALLAAFQITPHIVLETANPELPLRMSVLGQAATLCPASAASDIEGHQRPNYVLLEHPLTYHTLVVAYYRKNPYLRDVVETLQEVYRRRHLPLGEEK